MSTTSRKRRRQIDQRRRRKEKWRKYLANLSVEDLCYVNVRLAVLDMVEQFKREKTPAGTVAGIPVYTDPDMPPDRIYVVQGGVVTGRIENIGPVGVSPIREAIGHMREKLLRISGMEQAHTGEKPSVTAEQIRDL